MKTHGNIICISKAMKNTMRQVEQVANSRATILLRGESGTGKELLTNYLYAASARQKKPFIKLNCAALPAHLLENELFGHERGC